MLARRDEERGRGIPRSEEERAARHEERFPGTPLPPRGTGLDIEGEINPLSLFEKVLLSVVAGIGLGIGFLIVKEVSERRG